MATTGQKRQRSSSACADEKKGIPNDGEDGTAAHPCLEFLMAQTGSEEHPFSVRFSETFGTTLVASRALAPHSLLFRLPSQYLITYDAVCATNLSKVIRECLILLNGGKNTSPNAGSNESIQLSPEEFTWLNMVYWRGSPETSSQQVYLNSLSNLPPNLAAWPQSLRDELIGSNVYAVIDESGESNQVDGNGRVVQNLLAKLDRIRSVLHGCHSVTTEAIQGQSIAGSILAEDTKSSIFTEESLSWARGHFLSRRFPANMKNLANLHKEGSSNYHLAGYGDATSMFIPVLDLMNHTPIKENACSLEMTDDGRYLQVCSGNLALERGDELFYCYSEAGLSNEVLLQGYGFCLPNNPADTVSVKISIKSTNGNTSSGRADSPPPFHIGRGGVSAIPSELWRTIANFAAASSITPTASFSEEKEIPPNDEKTTTRQYDEDDGKQESIEIGSGDLYLLLTYMTNKLTLLNANKPTKFGGHKNSNTYKERLAYIEMYKSGQREILEALIQDLTQMLDGFNFE
jgi:hypothetical protein